MTKPESNQPRNFVNEENPQIILESEEFIQKLLQDFAKRDLSQLSPDQAKALASMPHKLQQYLQVLQQIKKEKPLTNPLQQQEKNKQNAEKLQKIATEVFTISCASSLPINDVLAFHEKAKLGVKGLNQFGENGLNPLAAALAGARSQSDLEKMLAAGADINFKSPIGNNAAHFAVMFSIDVKTIDFLVARGVDLNAKNEFGMTPLDMAVMKGDENMAKFLSDRGGKLSSLSKQKEEEKDQKTLRKKDEEKPQQKSTSELEKIQKETAEKIAQQEAQLKAQEQLRLALELTDQHEARLAREQKLAQQKSEEKKPEEKPKNDELSAEKEMLKKFGIDLEKTDINALLFSAVVEGKSMIAVLLIGHGADVNHREKGVSVLEAALSRQNNSLAGLIASRVSSETRELAISAIAGKNENARSDLERVINSVKKETPRENLEEKDKSVEKKSERSAPNLAREKPAENMTLSRAQLPTASCAVVYAARVVDINKAIEQSTNVGKVA